MKRLVIFFLTLAAGAAIANDVNTGTTQYCADLAGFWNFAGDIFLINQDAHGNLSGTTNNAYSASICDHTPATLTVSGSRGSVVSNGQEWTMTWTCSVGNSPRTFVVWIARGTPGCAQAHLYESGSGHSPPTPPNTQDGWMYSEGGDGSSACIRPGSNGTNGEISTFTRWANPALPTSATNFVEGALYSVQLISPMINGVADPNYDWTGRQVSEYFSGSQDLPALCYNTNPSQNGWDDVWNMGESPYATKNTYNDWIGIKNLYPYDASYMRAQGPIPCGWTTTQQMYIDSPGICDSGGCSLVQLNYEQHTSYSTLDIADMYSSRETNKQTLNPYGLTGAWWFGYMADNTFFIMMSQVEFPR